MDPIDRQLDVWRPMFADEKDDTQLSYKICALRETFEECGILLGDHAEKWEAVPENERRQWRDRVHQKGSTFLDLWRMLGPTARPSVSSLTYRANWMCAFLIVLTC